MATDEVSICNDALSRLGANTITSLTADSCKEDRLCNRFYAKLRDDLLKKFSWNFAKRVAPLNRTDLYDASDDYSDEVTITNITTGNPAVVTAANSYSAGMIVKIYDVLGMTEVNDHYFEIAEANTATFSLLGVDAGKYDTYSSGGKAVRCEPLALYESGYTYDLPSDCLKPLYLDSGDDYEIFQTRLLTQDDEPVLIYTNKATDTTTFSDEFEECLFLRLVTVLAIPLLGAKAGTQLLPTYEAMYRQALREAEKVNCNEIKRGYGYDDPWVTTRA